jgi:hypothetical protein
MSSVLLDLTSVILLSTRIAGGSTDILVVVFRVIAHMGYDPCARVLATALTGCSQYMLRFISVIGGFPDDAVSVLAITHLPRIMY